MTPFEKGVTQSDFDKQMKCLVRWFRVIPLEHLVKELKNGTQFYQDTVAITFDDGYQDNFTHAYPILRKYGLPATIFLIADFVGTSRWIWWDYVSEILKSLHQNGSQKINLKSCKMPAKLERKIESFWSAAKESELGGQLQEICNLLKVMPAPQRDQIVHWLADACQDRSFLSTANHRFLSWDQVLEMSRNGVTFGAHTRTHPNLSTLEPATMKREIVESKEILEKKLGSPVRLFAYPSGDFDQRTKDEVKNNGFLAACSTQQGRTDARADLFELKRFGICEDTFKGLFGSFSKSLFYLKMSGLFDRYFL